MKHAGAATIARRMLLALLAAAAHAAAADRLTVISFGRADQDALSGSCFKPFGQATGIEVRSLSYDGQTTELEHMVGAGAPEWDVMQVESRTLQLGCAQGLFEKIDFGRVGAVGDFVPGAVSDCGVGIFTWSMAIVYTDRLAATPHSWADFWDVKKFPGKRGLRRSAKYTLEIALLADGVAPRDVYTLLATPAGVERALHKLGEIKANIVWWEGAAQPGALLADGDLVMSAAYTLWFDPQEPRNRHFAISWDESLYDVDSWAIPKGSPRLEQAYRFIAFASAPERQRALAERVFYGPANRKAWALLAPDALAKTPRAPFGATHALKVDAGFWIAHGAQLEQQFDDWAPPMCRQQTDDDEGDYRDVPDCQDLRGRFHARSDRHDSGTSPERNAAPRSAN